MNSYIKKCATSEEATRESVGYEFFSIYFENIPCLLQKSEDDGFEVAYENRDTQTTSVLTDYIARGEVINVNNTFHQLSDIANTYAVRRRSDGGTQLFYIKRLNRLSTTLSEQYVKWSQLHEKVDINHMTISVDSDLIGRVSVGVTSFAEGICIPSQGDIHERNLFSDGTIIDFEGAGWNLLATDVATFIWHTLFAGNYFGPLYAKWSKHADKVNLSKRSLEIYTKSLWDVHTDISVLRISLLSDFMTHYVKRIRHLSPDISRDTELAIAFRLLTTFPVVSMTDNDRHMSFALANLFMDKAAGNLEKKLQLICQDKLVDSGDQVSRHLVSKP